VKRVFGVIALALGMVLCAVAEVAPQGRRSNGDRAENARGVRLSSFDIPFVPTNAPRSRVSVGLRVIPGKNMPFVSATLNGRECNLLFDTGATHTTFDIGFMRRALPEVRLDHVVLGGDTNVEGAPKIFHVDSLKLGDAAFGGFEAMALDISHLVPGIGVKVDGIVGMNVIGRVPALVSLGSGKAVFLPGRDDLVGFGRGIARSVSDPFTVALAPKYNGKAVPLIVDSAASLTILGTAVGWPSAKKTLDIDAVEVNGKSEITTDTGVPGKLALGEDVEIAPVLVDELISRIGADTLLKYDMLVDEVQARFRKCGGAHQSMGAIPCPSR